MNLELSLFGPKARTLFGLDVSSSAVKLVELSSTGKGAYQVDRYAIEALPKDAVIDGSISMPEAVEETLKRALKRMSTSTNGVAMALPASAVISKKINVPAGMRASELEEFVVSEAGSHIPFPMEEVNLDFQVLGKAPDSPEEVEVLLAAARKEKIEDMVALADSVGLKAMVLDVDAYAIQAAFGLVVSQLPGQGKGTYALVDIGASMMRLTVLHDGEVVYNREQNFGGNTLTQNIMMRFGMDHNEAENGKRNHSLPEEYLSEILPQFLDSLALEVSRLLQFFFTATQYNRVDHVVLAGGCAAIEGVDELVATRTQVDTVIANPFAGMLLSSKVRPQSLLVDAPSLMTACGLALRRFDPS
ncbi:MAG: pilus assembly protein PilM [Zoogloeaceae bacterium]|nr:pilus assembly protein PilM [Zoogloeaceae bacterium]